MCGRPSVEKGTPSSHPFRSKSVEPRNRRKDRRSIRSCRSCSPLPRCSGRSNNEELATKVPLQLQFSGSHGASHSASGAVKRTETLFLSNPMVVRLLLYSTICVQYRLSSLCLATAMIMLRACKARLPKSLLPQPSLTQRSSHGIKSTTSMNTTTTTNMNDRKLDPRFLAAWNSKRRVLEDLKRRFSNLGKAWNFVETALSLQTGDIRAIRKEDMLHLAERLLRAQSDFSRQTIPSKVDVAYHHTPRENLQTLRTKGLMTRCQSNGSSSSYGDGIYCSSDPLRFSRNGDTTLVIARMKGIESSTATTTRNPFHTRAAKGFCVLRESSQCVPLFQFPSELLRRDGFLRQLADFHRTIQWLLLDKFLNKSVPTVFPGFPGNVPPSAGRMGHSTLAPLNDKDDNENDAMGDNNDNRARGSSHPAPTKTPHTERSSESARQPRRSSNSNHSNAMTNATAPTSRPPLWSGLETPGMLEAKCSLLIQEDVGFQPRVKRLPKQRVLVYQDRGYHADIGPSRGGSHPDDENFYVDFEGCTILQLEPSLGSPQRTMPITLTVGGYCVFTPDNFRDFKVMMRTREQAKSMKIRPNGNFDWPGVQSLMTCPLCSKLHDVPREGDGDYEHEYWMLFYPLLQITIRKGSQMVLGTRMSCRLACLDCMEGLLDGMTCTVCPPLNQGRQSKVAFALTAREVLMQAGSAAFLEDGPPMPETHPLADDILDAWTLYNLWEHSGAWEALQNDYRMFLSRSMSSPPQATSEPKTDDRTGKACGNPCCRKIHGESDPQTGEKIRLSIRCKRSHSEYYCSRLCREKARSKDSHKAGCLKR